MRRLPAITIVCALAAVVLSQHATSMARQATERFEQRERSFAEPVEGSRVTIHGDIPFALFHKKCGGLAFFVNHRPVIGEQVRAVDYAMSDGSRPAANTISRCSTCGRVVAFSYRGEAGLCFEGECE